MDRSLVTFEVVFPRGLDAKTAVLAFSSLRRVFEPPKWPGTTIGRPTLVPELLARPDGLHHLISCPPAAATVLRNQLTSLVPGIVMSREPLPAQPPIRWTKVMLLDRRLELEPEKDSERQINAILGALTLLQEGETALIQLPLTASGEAPGLYWGVPRLAVHAHPIRAKKVMQGLVAAYGGTGLFAPRPVETVKYKRYSVSLPPQATPYLNRQVSDRAAPVVEWSSTLTAEDLVMAWAIPLNTPQVPGLVLARQEVSDSIPSDGPIPLGESTQAGLIRRPVTTTLQALNQHYWLTGGSGLGKTHHLRVLGEAVMRMPRTTLVAIDPKGAKPDDLADGLLSTVPLERTGDVIYFDTTDRVSPVGFNLLRGPDPARTAKAVTALFKTLWSSSWGPRLERILTYAVYTAASQGGTLEDVKELLVNRAFRRQMLKHMDHHGARQFWRDLEEGPDNAIDSVVNKLDAFVAFPPLNNIVGQKAGLDMAEVVRKPRILLVKLPEAEFGQEEVSLLGAMLLRQLWTELRVRRQNHPVVLLVDEQQLFAREEAIPVEDMLALGRSYGLHYIGANQDLEHLPKSLLATLRSNVATIATFGLSPKDARDLSEDYGWPAEDLMAKNMSMHTMAARLNTAAGKAPTVAVHTPPAPSPTGAASRALADSRARYGMSARLLDARRRERYPEAPEPPAGRQEVPIQTPEQDEDA